MVREEFAYHNAEIAYVNKTKGRTTKASREVLDRREKYEAPRRDDQREQEENWQPQRMSLATAKKMDLARHDVAFQTVARYILMQLDKAESDGVAFTKIKGLRKRFIYAVKYRMAKLTKDGPHDETYCEKLTRFCYHAGLGHENAKNPLLQIKAKEEWSNPKKEIYECTPTSYEQVAQATPQSFQKKMLSPLTPFTSQTNFLKTPLNQQTPVYPNQTPVYPNQNQPHFSKTRLNQILHQTPQNQSNQTSVYQNLNQNQPNFLTTPINQNQNLKKNQTLNQNLIQTNLIQTPLNQTNQNQIVNQNEIVNGIPRDKPTIEVIAPCNLPQGYQFEIYLNDTRYLAVTPYTVKEHEKFTSIYEEVNEQLYITIPHGKWRDGLFDCLSFGICHSLLWNSICWPMITMGQIMTRLGMNWVGTLEKNPHKSNRTFVTLLFISLLWTTLNILLVYYVFIHWALVNEVPKSVAIFTIASLANIFFLLYAIYLATIVRHYIRKKYHIHGKGIAQEDYGDFCLSVFCLSLNVAQMGRMTANYTLYRDVCCSSTGLPDHVGLHCINTQPPSKIQIV